MWDVRYMGTHSMELPGQWSVCCWVQVQTEVMGDIHHYAWRARFRNQTVYIDKRDGERFADWTSQQCAVSTRAHAAHAA